MLIEVSSDIKETKYLINLNLNSINEEPGYGSNSHMKLELKQWKWEKKKSFDFLVQLWNKNQDVIVLDEI
jgi:hypothetical protein